jgi:hypothetical protein
MTAPLIPKVSTLAAARTVSQTAHGFTAGQTIYRSATAWALAKSDALTTLSTGVVLSVTDANTFIRATDGDVVGGYTGLTSGAIVHASAATAGAIATAAQGAAPASAVAQNPIGEAISATEIIYHSWPALAV